MDIKDKIKSFEDALLSEHDILLYSVLKEAIEIIKYLKDENDSLYGRLKAKKPCKSKANPGTAGM